MNKIETLMTTEALEGALENVQIYLQDLAQDRNFKKSSLLRNKECRFRFCIATANIPDIVRMIEKIENHIAKKDAEENEQKRNNKKNT